ncbi:MAG: adenine phosphoribosyltransferase [Vezdaea aestivalis]|nr:MAG: adenine phosphoribosyltransferase [Vezdaea aestivalis]
MSHPSSSVTSNPSSITPTIYNGSKGSVTPAAPAGTSELSSYALELSRSLQHYPDFPVPGILFADIFPLFANPTTHADLLKALTLQVNILDPKPDVIVGLDARGFLFGPALALAFNASFVPVRKKGKLPGKTVTVGYDKEYGSDLFEIQEKSIKPGQKVLIADDVIATGGTAAAAGELVRKVGGTLLGYLFILELVALNGRDKLDASVFTLLSGRPGPDPTKLEYA